MGKASHLGRDKDFASLSKNQPIVIDELGYLPIDTERARLLFQVIADGYEKRSLIITTNDKPGVFEVGNGVRG